MRKGYFITGTDTDVGKTQIAAALLIALKNQGFSTLAIKPISTGSIRRDNQLYNEDADYLQTYSTEKLAISQINPISFTEYTAPHIAAEKNNIKLSVNTIIESCQSAIDIKTDILIVEGTGGFLVPLNDKENTADLVKAFGFPVIFVVGIRLGCINHTLLTLESMERRKTVIIGWVANCIQPDMPYLLEYIQTLRDYIPAPLLGRIPFQSSIDPKKISTFMNIDILK